METHVKILAILKIVFGSLGALAALIVLVVFGGLAGLVGMTAHSHRDGLIAIPILGGLGIGLSILILLLSIPGIVAGFGLLKFRPWARVLTIVLCALNLLNFPLGTAIGVYGLWVLLTPETVRLFEVRRV